MSFVEDFIQVAVDGAGKKVRNLKNTIGANDVEQQVVTLAGPNGDIISVVNTAPEGGAWGLVTRNIPSGVQAVSGPLTDAELRAAAVAVSGPLTDAQLRAAAVPISGNVGVLGAVEIVNDVGNAIPISAASLPLPTGAATETTLAARLAEATFTTRIPTVGQKAMAGSVPVVLASDQSTVPVSMAAASVLFRGRASTFRTPGRAGTVGQKILSLHNATGSTVKAYVTKVTVDLAVTVVKAITVLPPVVRLWKVTVLPSNGTALTKNKIGGTTTSNAAVTVLGDASADGTGSGTTLTATLPAGTILAQEFAGRFITAAGYEMADRIEFVFEDEIELLALEGVVLFLDYTLATQNPTTDMWAASVEWHEKA